MYTLGFAVGRLVARFKVGYANGSKLPVDASVPVLNSLDQKLMDIMARPDRDFAPQTAYVTAVKVARAERGFSLKGALDYVKALRVSQGLPEYQSS